MDIPITGEAATPAVNATPLFDFKKEQEEYNDIIASFGKELNTIEDRRKLRKNKRNVQEERQKKTLLGDETIIPDRTIDTNIRLGRAPYIQYMTQCRNLLKITEIGKPQISLGPLEEWFTRGMRYPKWKDPWIKLIDAFHTHGGAAMEIVYDTSKPLNVGWEYIPRDSLLFDARCCDIQDQPRLLRRYKWTVMRFEEAAEEYGFELSYVKEIINSRDKRKDPIDVYKVYCKKQGAVYIAWYCKECDKGWLKEPTPLELGLFEFDIAVISQQTPAGVQLYLDTKAFMEAPEPSPMMNPDGTMQMDQMGAPIMEQKPPLNVQMSVPKQIGRYPVIWFPYELTEDEVLLESQGRVALDIHVQEAMTRMLSNTVNASTRASQFYPSRKNDPTMGGESVENVVIEHGKVVPFELAVFQPPWPEPIILAITQALRQGKSQETGQQDYAALARKDANKTATEMELANTKAATNTSTDMDVFSSPTIDALALPFEIARHQAIFGYCERPVHPELLIGKYHLATGGDIEVVKKEETKQNAKEFFNILKGTPAAEKVLVMLIKEFFPDQADEWIAMLQGPDFIGIIAQLVQILQGFLKDYGDTIDPTVRQRLADVIATASSVVTESTNPISAPEAGAGSAAPAQAANDGAANPREHTNNPVET